MCLKQVYEYDDCTILFEMFERRIHHKKLSHMLYVFLKLICFKMINFDTKIQHYIDMFGDLITNLQDLEVY